MYYNYAGKALSLGQSGQNWMPKHSAGKITGTSYNDVFYAIAGDEMYGGAGDDHYYIWSNNFSITEYANSGADTLYSYAYTSITLPDNVENLFLMGSGSVIGIGNSLDNIISATDYGAYLSGGKGNDVLIGGKGLDIFSILAGNGSDVIVNFEIGRDIIRLDGYSVGGLDGLMESARQVGADVNLTLGNGESLMLRNIDLADLSEVDFAFRNDAVALADAAEAAPVSGKMHTLYGTHSGNSSNGWYAINNAWNAGNLVYGSDYTNSVTYNISDLSKGTTFTWSFPDVALAPGEAGKILAYPDLLFGASPFSGGINPGDKAQVFPVQLSALTSLTTSYSIAFSGDAGGFNVAYDLWLTSVAGGDASTVTNEIMIWLHQGDFEAFGERIGSYLDGDFAATVYHAEATNYTAIVVNELSADGTINMLKLFDYLESLGIVSEDEYLAASQLGAEVSSGSGELTINSLSYDVQTQNADGSVTRHIVTGTGATSEIIMPVGEDEEVVGKPEPIDAGKVFIGTDGDDSHILQHEADSVVEQTNGGIDTVYSRFSHALGDNVENLMLTGDDAINGTGNELDNHITGNSADNRLEGGEGNDILDGGAGADTFFGGDGFDFVSYESATSGVTVDLWLRNSEPWFRAYRGDAVGDTFDSIEGIIGSSYNDVLLGDNYSDDTLFGGAGDDNLYGRGGNDVLHGGAGRDTLTGGWGHDIFLFNLGDGRDIIDDFQYMNQKDIVVLDKDLGVSSFADVQAHLTQQGGNAVLTFDGGDTLVFYNIRASSLVESDFVFA